MPSPRLVRLVWLGATMLIAGTIGYLWIAAPAPPLLEGPVLPRRSAPLTGPDANLPALLLGWWAWLVAIVMTPVFWWISGLSPSVRRTALMVATVAAAAGLSLLSGNTAAGRWTGHTVPIRYLFDYQRVVIEAIPFVLAALGASLARAHRADSLLRAVAAESRLTALTAQLQPHFLFNTLQAVSTALHRDPIVADRMIGALSDLLRGALDGTRSPVVPLGRELELLESYLAILRERFADRLTTRVNVADDLRSIGVPVLLLQPLVENAVRHGIEGREGPASILVTAQRNGTELVVMVDDDGTGPPDGAPSRGNGVGLANTRERLTTIYGMAASLSVKPLRQGTRVTVTLPVERPRR